VSKLYKRVRQARKLAELTQDELALDLHLTRSAIAQWEMANGTAPSVENMIALALRTGMGFEFLATGRGPMIVSAPTSGVTEGTTPYITQIPLTDQQRLLLERFDALSARQQAGLLALLAEGAKRKRR